MDNNKVKQTRCCEPFNPEPWEEKELNWNNKLFVKDRIISFLHIPLNIGAKITKNMGLIEKASAKASQQLMLSDENSLWGADIYIDVLKEVPGAQMAAISGKFLTKVFEGSYKDIGKWVKEMEQYVKSKGKVIKKLYFYYAACPKCAKKYGKNYIVLFAEVE